MSIQDPIHRKEDQVTMWELIGYQTLQTVMDASFLPALLQREYDCGRHP